MQWLTHGILIVLAAAAALACQEKGLADPDAGTDLDADTDADTDADIDSDSDADSDTGAEECTECPEGEICISWVRGRLLYEDGTPVTGVEQAVKFHIKVCHVVEPDEDGYFEVYKGCYHKDEPFFMDIPSITAIDGTRTRYTIEYDPSREQVMDQGPDDFVFDVGTHYWWALPEPTASYTAQDGATVDAAGVSFEVAPGALGEEDLELGVFEFPLDQWVPPFIDNIYNPDWTVDHVDALYHLFPYWQMVVEGEGLVLRIDPPEGWTETDSGRVYLLGDWIYGYAELPEHGEVQSGRVVEVGPTSYEDGLIVTPPIPVLGWVMLVKD